MTMAVEHRSLTDGLSYAARLRQGLALLLDGSESVRFESGAALYRENDAGEAIFLLESGVVKQIRACRGGECIVGLSNRGEFLGIRDVMLFARYSSGAVAIGPVSALRIEREEFGEFLQRNPSLQLTIFGMLSRSIEDVESKLVSISTKSARRRVAWALLKLRKALLSDNTVEPRLAVSDISALSTCADGTLVKLLRDFERRSLIKRSDLGIEVLDESGLRRVSGEY